MTTVAYLARLQLSATACSESGRRARSSRRSGSRSAAWWYDIGDPAQAGDDLTVHSISQSRGGEVDDEPSSWPTYTVRGSATFSHRPPVDIHRCWPLVDAPPCYEVSATESTGHSLSVKRHPRTRPCCWCPTAGQLLLERASHQAMSALTEVSTCGVRGEGAVLCHHLRTMNDPSGDEGSGIHLVGRCRSTVCRSPRAETSLVGSGAAARRPLCQAAATDCSWDSTVSRPNRTS